MLLDFINISSERYVMENTVGQTQTIQVPNTVQMQNATQVSNVAQVPNTVQVPNYSGVNIQIFNPSVTAPGGTAASSTVNAPNYSTNPCAYPANYYTQNLAQPVPVVQPIKETGKKTEKREIVQLTDDYIKNLENSLNSYDAEVRAKGAKEVVQRFEEDKSRRNDPALNALVNKMLQDPSYKVRFFALAALNSRSASGDEKTKSLLKNLQQKQTQSENEKEDALMASGILLKMSSNLVDKEFEVQDNKKSKGEKE